MKKVLPFFFWMLLLLISYGWIIEDWGMVLLGLWILLALPVLRLLGLWLEFIRNKEVFFIYWISFIFMGISLSYLLGANS